MTTLDNLIKNNKEWSDKVKKHDPEFFSNLSKQQKPQYLWIGCSDSRVPANQITGLMPGEVFVHRNIANVVAHSDMNCLSVIQYAVKNLEVKHIIVCGHYGCGGVEASIGKEENGLIDNWLQYVEDIYNANKKDLEELRRLKGDKEFLNRLCELNVINQVDNVCNTTVVKNAWKADQDLTIHGWIYNLHDGLVKSLVIREGINND
ncbi:MAG: carbonate dehydratase [Proteobacteria bacterium]|nr:carbonate dehydratase [Pseudomonadota bacterium]